MLRETWWCRQFWPKRLETTFSCKTELFHLPGANCLFFCGRVSLHLEVTRWPRKMHGANCFFMGVFLSTWMFHVPAWGVVKTLHAAPFFLRAALECRRTCYLCNCITFSTLVMVLTLNARYIRKMFLVLGKWSKLVLIILCTTIASRAGPFNSKTKFHHVPQIQVFVPQHPLKHVRNVSTWKLVKCGDILALRCL